MFDILRNLFGLSPREDFWLEDASMEVGVLVVGQLKECDREGARSWGVHSSLILGYICGASGRLCADQSLGILRESLLPGTVLAELTGAPFEVARDDLKRAQMQPADPGYLLGYQTGWVDWAVRRTKGHADGLLLLLQGHGAGGSGKSAR